MPSRRRVIEATGIALTTGLAGCAGFGAGGEATGTAEGTEGGGESDGDISRVTVQLVGSETDATLFDSRDADSVGSLRESEDPPFFEVTLTDGTATSVSKTFRDAGVADDASSFEVVVQRGDEEVNRFGIQQNLAQSIASDEWDGSFVFQFESVETARAVRESFVAGSEN
jgi:hypothetical protein